MGRLTRHLSSRIGRILNSGALATTRRGAHEGLRLLRRAPHRVHYFHQVDDPYSDLAAQTIPVLEENYDIEIIPHLVSAHVGPNLPEPELFAQLARHDVARVAPHYGLVFPSDAQTPSAEAVAAAQNELVPALRHGGAAFAEGVRKLGTWLWTTGAPDGSRGGASSSPPPELTQGNALREKFGHYSSATFYYAGEWYWGVDRLYHLENRLAKLGAARLDDAKPCFDRPAVEQRPVQHAEEMRLEIFPSLRSPYSAIGFAPALAMARETGVPIEVRPVLPMVMRGVPVTFQKGIYLLRDTKREAAALGMPFGKMFDPIGEPTRKAFSLWPHAREQGRGNEYLVAFLSAAFAEGIDTSVESGLRTVVEVAGLSWSEAQARIGDNAYETILESNRLAMVEEMGLWGVPSFRLRGPGDEPELVAWGQDRLWLVSREIQRRGNA